MSWHKQQIYFVVPAFLMLIVMGLMIFIEYNIENYQESVQFVIEDKVPLLSDKIDRSLQILREDIEFFSVKSKPEHLANIFKDIADARTQLENLYAYFNDHPEEMAEHSFNLTPLNEIEHCLDRAQNLANALPQKDPATLVQLKQASTLASTTIHDFKHDTDAIHGREIDALSTVIDHSKYQKDFLSVSAFFVFILMSGLLYRNARRYRQEMERVQAAEQRYALLAAVVHTTRIGVMIRDLQHETMPIVFVNQAFTDITGYELEDARNKPPYFLMGLHTDPHTMELLKDGFVNNKVLSLDVLVYRKDNTPFWSEWHIGPVQDEHGTVTHYFSLITDTSTLRNTRESLLLAKEEAERADKVKSSFLATMSHELRTPINGVLGVMDLLTDSKLDNEQRRLVQIASTSGQHLLEIINDVLDYSKIEAGKLEIESAPFRLRALIDETIEMIKPIVSAKRLTLSYDISADTPDALLGDNGRIKQILLNLLANAIKFTEQGSVDLRISTLLAHNDHEQDVSLIRFEVTDTGIGISVEDQEKLFNEFTQIERSFTRRFGGTGLGLAITKQLVKLLNGEIGVESRLGQGSKFWFMLPIQQNLAQAEQDKNNTPVTRTITVDMGVRPPPAPLLSQSQHCTAEVLLAEDNPVNQLVATRFLQKAGLHVEIAANGVEAVAKASQKNYDAILMDISMPEKDGLAATREIRQMGGPLAEIPIIAVTAHVMRGDREQCIAAGMNDYLCKPLHYESLRKVLARWLPKDKFTYAPDAAAPPPPAPEPKMNAALADIPIYDENILAMMAHDLDHTMILNITQVFLDDFSRRVDRLNECLSGSDLTETARTAHALKSSSASCGLLRFSEIMRQIEAAANKKESERLQELAGYITGTYSESRQALIDGRKKYQA